MQSLSKTDFLNYLDNPKHFWVSKHAPDQLAPLDDFTRHQLEQGNEVQVIAKDYFRNYLFQDEAKYDVKTEYSISNGPLVARIDILVHDLVHDVYDVYEIKGSTNSKLKSEHKYDLAFQAHVIGDELSIRDYFLVRLNSEYEREGELIPADLFVIDSMNDEVEKLGEETSDLINAALAVMSETDMNNLEACFKPSSCPCRDICHPDLPEHPIYELSRLSKAKASLLRAQDKLKIAEILPDFELTHRQTVQRKAVIAEVPIIDKPALNEFLSDVEYPLYYLDYETLGLAIPAFDGYRPYQNMIFQYSLHVQEKKGGGVHHYEYLAIDREDPGLGLVKHLSENIGSTGSMIVWNQGFEVGRNKEMAEMYPDYADLLLGLNDRSFDLMKAFSKTIYIDPDFGGSASLKKVLPVLLPGLGGKYSEMSVSNGAIAMLTWKELIWGDSSAQEADSLQKALLSYCELDTLAMVEILKFLYAI